MEPRRALVMVLAGVVVGLLNSNSISLALNTEAVQHAAEFILAVLLFVDATEIREGRLWGRSPGLVARLLFLAMPLSLALAMLTGWAEHVPQPRHPRPSRTRRTYYRRLSRDLRRLPRTHRHP